MDLKSYLHEHNETAASFARRCELSRSTVYNLLNGGRPTFDVAEVIAGLTDGMVPLTSWPPNRNGKGRLTASAGKGVRSR